MTARLLTNIGRRWTGSEILSNAAVLTSDDRIAWVGPAAELPRSVPGVVKDIVDVDLVENLGGGFVTPGLIDSHTHPVYAGNRDAEVAMRSNGLSDAEITAAGGGINATLTITRGTDPWTLCNGVRERLAAWLQTGTTTIEAKTGYHLTRDWRARRRANAPLAGGGARTPRVHVTFLAAHVVPPEYFGRRTDYIDAVGAWCAETRRPSAPTRRGRQLARKAGSPRKRPGGSCRRAAGLGPEPPDPRLRPVPHRRRPGPAAEMGCASADLLNNATEEDVASLSRAWASTGRDLPATAMQASAAPGALAAAQGRHGGTGVSTTRPATWASPPCRLSSRSRSTTSG